MADFVWNDWNEEHATKQGVSIMEAEHVVRNAARTYPKQRTTIDGSSLGAARGTVSMKWSS